MLCSQCGMEVPADSAFCHGCGSPVAVATKECIATIKGWRGVSDWDRLLVYFTPDGVIVAKTGHYAGFFRFFLMNIGYLLAWLFVMRSADRRADKLARMGPEALLAADKFNFRLGYDEITNVVLQTFRNQHILYIIKSATWLRVRSVNQHDFEAAREALPQVLGEKLKVILGQKVRTPSPMKDWR